mgnify:CR=1 FL=1
MQYRKISISVLDNKSGDSIVGALAGYIKESNVSGKTAKDIIESYFKNNYE